jgi:carboxymethylenebutenolidase
VDLAGDLKAPVLGLYGAEDTGIPLDTVEQMRSKLAEAAKLNPNAANSRIEVFAAAQHGFHADYRNTYNSTAAKEAYNQALQFLRSKNVL